MRDDNNINNNENNTNTNNNNQNEKDLADKAIDAVEGFMNTEDHSKDHRQLDIDNYKTSAAFCYVPLICIYFLATNQYRKNDYMHFHVNQGFVLTIVWALILAIVKITTNMFRVHGLFVTYVPPIVSFINYSLVCFAIFYTGFGFINTINGNSKELPLIGKIKIYRGLGGEAPP